MMVKQGHGNIINITSATAELPLTRVLGYSSAKAAVKNLTQWLAVEFAHKYGENIRVNALTPGFFLTEQNRFLLTNPDGSFTPRGELIVQGTPMNRMGKPEDLQGALLYLARDAPSFVPGRTRLWMAVLSHSAESNSFVPNFLKHLTIWIPFVLMMVSNLQLTVAQSFVNKDVAVVSYEDNEKYRFSEGLCAIQRDQLWGFMDTTGKVVIDFRFRNNGYEIPAFHEGKCCVCIQTEQEELRRLYID